MLLLSRPAGLLIFHAMHKRKNHRAAYDLALQFEHLALRIVDAVQATHPEEADELTEYTNGMLSCFRRSNGCVATDHGRQESFQAAVWMVEAQITLNALNDADVESALITAASELLERMEYALRAEGSLPPVRE